MIPLHGEILQGGFKMEDSIILDDIKKFMQINYDDDSFNDQLILQINYALSLVIAK